MLKLPVKPPIVDEDIDLSEYAKKSDVDAIDASLDNKADKKEVEKISEQLDTIVQEVEQIGLDKIPNDIFQVAVDKYIQDNNSGLVTQKKLNECIIDSKNLIDTTKSTIGKFIWYADGTLGDSSQYDTTDYIPILTGDKIAFSPKIRKLLEYNTSKTAITNTLVDELK